MKDRGRRRFSGVMLQHEKAAAFQGCLAQDADCSGTIARAHSVQNGRSLDSISRDGKVYMFLRNHDRPGYSFRPVGRNQATTFTGFCNHHDATVFREIDTADMAPPTKRQVVLHALRAVARECWAKLSVIKGHEQLLALNRSNITTEELASLMGVENPSQIDRTFFDHAMNITLAGTRSSAARMTSQFASYREQLRSDAFHLTETAVFEFVGAPRIGASALATPEFDFVDQKIAKLTLAGYQSDMVICVVPFRGRTVVMLAYHKRDRRVLGSLPAQLRQMSDAERGVALSRFLVINCENVAFAPDYIDALPDVVRAAIERAFHLSMHEVTRQGDTPAVNFFTAGSADGTGSAE
jgi:hypothetical protein